MGVVKADSEEVQKAGVAEASTCFQYDEFCDLLGGAAWEPVFQQWIVSGLLPRRQESLSWMAPRFTQAGQFLFDWGGAQLFPLEVLWLKFNLFKSLCQKLQAFYEKESKPHLNLQPPHALIESPSSAADFVPARWLFSLRLAEVETASASVIPGLPSELTGRLYAPPHPQRGPYTAPVMKESPLGQEERATVLIRTLEQVREPQAKAVQGFLEAQIISEGILPSSYSAKDVFLIMLPVQGPESPPVRFWASEAAALEKGLLLRGTTEPMGASVWEALVKGRQTVFSHSQAAIYRSYHLPCDVYALGMLLARTLLVNERQDIQSVERKIRQAADGLEPMVQGLEADDDRTVSKRLRIYLREYGETFSQESVLYGRKEENSPWERIPDEIWYDALVLLFRLVSWIPGFGFCRDHGDYDLTNLQMPMERINAGVQRLENRIKMELFGSRQRNREILKACDLLRDELTLSGSGHDAF